MQVFWEKIGILGPVYRSIGRGLSDSEIANDLDITDERVHECIDWIQHFLHCKDRNEVARDAATARVT
jgi:DNA-binding NarL/FixJ family response regulator